MSWQDDIYRKLPQGLQNLAISTYGLYSYWVRFGPGFDRYVKSYCEREHFQSAEWQAWQRQRLQEILTISLAVPYYAQTWSESQKRAAEAGQLVDLPLLAKDPLRTSPQDFVRSDLHPRRTFTFYTSGSTGTPIATIWTAAEKRTSLAMREARSVRWAGVSYQQPRATFSGRILVPDSESKGPYYRYNAVEKQVYFSPYHLSPETAAEYLAGLTKYHVRWLTGYAVSYYLLAKFIVEQGLPAPAGIQALIITSEKATPEMRDVMEKAFHCRVYEEYSSVENVLFASECEHGRLHVSPDAGIVEILRADGAPCGPGEVGEVVATGLMRSYQPLIRYRLGDVAMWDPEPCACGRQMPVIKEVLGRIEDVVIGPDGRQMVRFHGVFVNQPHIREGQIIQEALDHIRVKVVPTDGFEMQDEAEVIHRVQQRLGKGVRVDVERVTEIPRTKTGKYQAVISKLKVTAQQ